MPLPDTLPNDAGSAALPSAMDFFNSLDEPQPDTPAAPPAPVDPPSPTDDFMPIDPPRPQDPPKPGDPLPIQDEEPVPDHVTRKGAEAVTTWKAARQEAKDLKRRLEDVERDREIKLVELEELKKKLEGAPPEDKLKELEEQVQKYEDQLGQIDITRSKTFQRQYDQPLHELFGKVVRTLQKTGIDERAAIEKARTIFRPGMENPSNLERALPDESSVVIGALSTLLEDREMLAVKRDEAIQNWRQTREASEMEERRQAATEIGEQLTRVSKSALDQVSKDGSWLFKEGQDPEWNKGVQARKDAVLGYLRAGKPEELARLVAEGIASPVYRKGYEQLKAAYDELKAKHEAVVGRRPGLENRSPADYSGRAPVAEMPKTVDGMVDRLWSED
jgi:hypothetical protein